MFWILKFRKLTGIPCFCKILTYFLPANLLSISVRAPVQTMLPDANASAVVRGFLIRKEAAANFCGLYSTNGFANAMARRSNESTPKLKAEKKS